MKRIISTALVLLLTTFVVAEEQKVVKTALEVNDMNKTESLIAVRAFNTAVKLGTLGLGVDVSTPINDKLSARFNLNGASYTDTQDNDGNEFEGTLDLLTVGALVDYYPFENNFRLSGGVYYNANEFTGTATPSITTTIELNDVEYTIDDIAKVNTDVTFNKFAPYVGVGWGNDARDKGWGFTLDLGVMYHGSAEAGLSPEIKDLNKIAEIRDAIKEEEKNIEDDLADYKVYPVVSVGVNYSF